MHAITLEGFGGPEKMRWTQLPDLEPGPGQVRIRTVAVGVNRADLLQRQGYYPPPTGASEILGLECSGVIDAIGEGVSGWQIGDEVVALLEGGGYAEQVVVAAGQVIKPPEGIDLVSAAGVIEVAATVLSNLDLVHLQKDEWFLVHGGAGGIGTFAIQYARALGAHVATTASAAKLDHCRQLGAEIVIDYADDWLTQLMMATEDRGVDVILDIIGAKYLADNVAALRDDGRLVIIGMQKGTKGELNIQKLLNKRGTIAATSLRQRPTEQKAEICRQVEERVWPLIASGQIKLAPETRVSLQEAAEAHQLLASGDVIGKVILTV
ncbi:NAD(P)H-quinone oxidoreductase [Propionimicrobium sp. PCR01-08-3]|uniref:NAD(P)H-quinone oxidoreductase n=1 Tax=Propionimicrobium sp. PCR01-08-3 TaxID=3052086 RepID=UPI00255CF0FE|nr:NAD(P)H-quinone oxidoreductase [Propionimicrobium sp. PCR01-08-3]WIY82728.1 NAD(P)H-quinone oxidoreductase [Propionimicrobium sp. PCR01-08-3]